jgi:hypothetical protein
MNVQGKPPLQFQVGGSEETWKHDVEVVSGDGVPNILGVGFWEQCGAKIDVGGETIQVRHADGEVHHIPMSICTPDEALRVASVEVSEDAEHARPVSAENRGKRGMQGMAPTIE